MERRVLLAAEQVEHCALGARNPAKVLDCGRIAIDTAKTPESRLHHADAGVTAIEPCRAATETTKQVEVPDFYLLHVTPRSIKSGTV